MGGACQRPGVLRSGQAAGRARFAMCLVLTAEATLGLAGLPWRTPTLWPALEWAGGWPRQPALCVADSTSLAVGGGAPSPASPRRTVPSDLRLQERRSLSSS